MLLQHPRGRQSGVTCWRVRGVNSRKGVAGVWSRTVETGRVQPSKIFFFKFPIVTNMLHVSII